MSKRITLLCLLLTFLSISSLRSQTIWTTGDGTSSSPYLIEDVANLQYLAQEVNSGTTYAGVYFEMSSDLDLSSLNWTPIGLNPKAFKGNFDGNNHAISNLTISTSSTFYHGLFGYVIDATISNLTLLDANIAVTSGYASAALCGEADGSTFSNCSVEATVNALYPVAGICSYATNTLLTNCSCNGTIYGEYYVGGICGSLVDSSVMINCLNEATIVGNTTSQYIGGLCGGMTGAKISGSSNLGLVKGITDVGGICGNNTTLTNQNSTIEYAFNSGDVSGTSSVGGICGSVSVASGENSTISYVYNIGTVTASSSYGALCGQESGATLTSCYYDSQRCTVGAVNNATATGATGELSINMVGASLFNDATHWAQSADVYPYPVNLANTDAMIVATTPIFLASDETVNEVLTDFTVGIENGVSYSATNDIVSISATGAASIGDHDIGILSITKGNASKGIQLKTYKTCTFDNDGGSGNASWSTATNWDAAPANDDGAVIAADASLNGTDTVAVLIVNSGFTLTLASGASLYVSGTVINQGSILIESGGEFIQFNDDITATVEYDIAAWTTDPVGGWYTIASPVAAQSISTLFGAQQSTSINVDLYAYSEPTHTWLNYHAGSISETDLQEGKGYLTAWETATTLQFSGALNNGALAAASLSYASTDPEVLGWNLVGNPYPRSIFLGQQAVVSSEVSTGYYLVTDGTELVAYTNDIAIAPCVGFFVEANADGQTVTFDNTATAKAEPQALSYLSLTVEGNGQMDRAYLQFGSAKGLSKFSRLSTSSPVIYIPQAEKDYAIAVWKDAKADSEVPICFKAGQGGQFTLRFDTKNVTFNSLLLIDKFTGIETDLLKTHHYTFVADKNQDPDRFRLLFDAADGTSVEENFAFYESGFLRLNTLEKEAQLQVIDLQGRVLVDEKVNGSYQLNLDFSPGVYVVRLEEPERIRVQKIVVK